MGACIATKLGEAKLDEMDSWMVDLIAIVRIALEDYRREKNGTQMTQIFMIYADQKLF